MKVSTASDKSSGKKTFPPLVLSVISVWRKCQLPVSFGEIRPGPECTCLAACSRKDWENKYVKIEETLKKLEIKIPIPCGTHSLFLCVGVCVCVCCCRVFAVTPCWQGKMNGLCYRFLADKSPYNHLISYYQQPQTLKLIFIGVKKRNSPRHRRPLWSSPFIVEFLCVCVFVCVLIYECLCVPCKWILQQTHPPSWWRVIAGAATVVGMSKVIDLELYSDRKGMRFLFLIKTPSHTWVASNLCAS